jgi:transcription elongation factor GreB
VSKAFTKDDAAPETLRRRPSTEPRHITPEGHAALKAEQERLLKERSELVGPDAGAEAQGRLPDVDARLAFLHATLEAVQVVTPDPGQERAFLGAWVTLEDEEGELVRYRLVGPDEADTKGGRVSVESPLGQALLGSAVDDEVGVERPRGRTRYSVIRVEYGLAGDTPTGRQLSE